MPSILGLDIGGSKTHALLARNGHVIAEAFAGSANISSVGEAAAVRALSELAERFGSVTVDVVCAGAAGADSEAGRERLFALLTRLFPAARILVTHDTHLILAAAGLTSGTVLISGTGSVAWCRTEDGRETRAGGWGYLLGDEGSGYAIVAEAVKAALADAEEGRPTTPLTSRLLSATAARRPWELLDLFYARPERRYWAGLSTQVFAAATEGDGTAVVLLDHAADSLAGLVLRACRRLESTASTDAVVLAGGLLTNSSYLADAVTARLRDAGLPDIHVLGIAPAFGAIALAETHLSNTSRIHS